MKIALGVVFMAKRSFFPGATGILNAAKYEIAKEGAIDLEGLYNKEKIESNISESKNKKENKV